MTTNVIDMCEWCAHQYATAQEFHPPARDAMVKAEALREAADFCEAVIANALGSGRDDFSDGWREASKQMLAEMRDLAVQARP